MSTTSGLRLTPQAVEVEKHILGGILLDKDAALSATSSLTKEDFFLERHEIIFEAIKDLVKAEREVDLLSLSDTLKKRGVYSEAGGDEYLMEISSEVVSAANIEDHCRIIKEKATLRALIRASTETLELAYHATADADKLLSSAEAKLISIADGSPTGKAGPLSARDCLKSTIELIERCHSGQIQGLQTHFNNYNALTGGICAPDWIVLAGRPGLGKTAFALDVADYLATDKNRQVVFFSLEMTKEQLLQRVICRREGIDFQLLRTGNLPKTEFKRIGDAVDDLVKSNLYIDDDCEATPGKILSVSRKHQAKHGLDLVVVDNLSLMESEKRSENRLQEVTTLTRQFKKYAKLLGVPILTLVHVNRGIEGRGEEATPRFSDLRECGTIEQDADDVFVMHRPDNQTNQVDLHCLKQRNGPTGVLHFISEFQYMRFKELTPLTAPF